MNKNITEISRWECTGCGACATACPIACIRLEPDFEGFFAPVVNSKLCLNCGQCLKACHTNRPLEKNGALPRAFIARAKNNKSILMSSSGGVFAETARFFIEKYHGTAYGAAYDPEMNVIHQKAENISEIPPLQNSKYVQSRTDLCFSEVEKKLKDGREVLFSGTPCQIAGLKTYLKNDYPNLFTIDLICHGVASPALLKRSFHEISKKYGSDVVSCLFRTRRPFNSKRTYYRSRIKLKNNKIIERNNPYDAYYTIYLRGLGFRESCYKCRYASMSRQGDLTVGDCDSHSLYEKFYPKASNSVVFLNTKKGIELWSNISSLFWFAEIDPIQEQKYNKQLQKPVSRPAERDDFYKNLDQMNWQEISAKYSRSFTLWAKVKNCLTGYIRF